MTIIDKVVVHCVDDTHGGTVGRQMRALDTIGGGEGGPVAWEDVTDKPSTFPPESHAHDGTYSPLGHNHDQAYDQAGAAATALQSALAADFSGSYADLTNTPATFPPEAHAHPYEPANANIQAHVAQAHAPANAQKNSDITKAEIEAVLTGEVSTHSHAGGGADPWTYKRLPADFTISTTAAGDVTNGGVLFGFTPAANTTYIWEAVLGIRTATATVNPRLGFAWSTGMTDGICSIEQTSTATAKAMANGNIAASLLVAVGGIPTNTTSWPAICYGSVRAGATPSGNCRMQLASETAGTIVRVVASISYFRFRTLS